jgi:hypothetical protein
VRDPSPVSSSTATPLTAQPSDIPVLGSAYNHARKAYGVTSALLMAWELIGVELAAAPVENLKLTLKSPQAAPYVLIVLIVYFGFRMVIEWYQTDPRRRQMRASKVDFVVAHCIAGASLALYGYQTVTMVQLVNVLPQHSGMSLVLGMSVGQTTFFLISPSGWRQRLTFIIPSGTITVLATLAFFAIVASPAELSLSMLIIGLIGFAFGISAMSVLKFLKKRSQSEST